MDPSPSDLLFIEPRAAVVFGLVLSLGLPLVSGFILLRPRPLHARRVLAFVGALAVGVAACAWLLLERSVRIDALGRQVQESWQVFGLGPSQRWSFEQIAAVALSHRPEGFELALDTAGGPVALRRFDELTPAESAARELAGIGGWKALRRGYRLEPAARAQEPLAFETRQGKRGVLFDFDGYVRVVVDAGAESIIEPQVMAAPNR